MKVLQLSETLEVGGAETFTIRLANGLASDCEVILAVIHGERVHPAMAAQLSSKVSLNVLRLPAKKFIWKIDSLLRKLGVGWSPVQAIASVWLRRLVRRERPQIVHSHLLNADWIASQVKARMRELRHIITIHGDYASYIAGETDPRIPRLLRRIDRIFGGADRVIAIAPQQLRLLNDRFPAAASKFELIRNGYAASTKDKYSSREDLGLPSAKFLFGMVARGVRKKGWAEAIAAFERLNRVDAGLVLVGEGPFLNKLCERGLPSGVLFAGFSERPLEFIRCFDVCLLPTLFSHEALPTVIIEYLFCGKPVIATDVGDIATMLTAPSGEIAGQLLNFDRGRVSVDEMTRAMRNFLDEPAHLKRLCAVARSAFDKFDMERCIASYREVYERVRA